MPDDPEYLFPLDAVTVGSATIIPDLFRPVAAIVEGGTVRWLTWSDAPLPDRALEEAEAWPTEGGVWVVYSSDDTVTWHRTAVHVAPEGVTTAIDLGDRRPIGADAGGLWIGDPRDPSAWTRHENDGEVEVRVDPETLDWVDAGPFWPDPEHWSPADDVDTDVDPDSDVDDATDADEGAVRYVVVAGGQPEWSIGFADADADTDGEPAFEPPTPSPTPPTDLVRIAPDGSRSTIGVDHLVSAARTSGNALTIRYHPAGPRNVPSEYGGWYSVYEPREVVVDVSDGLPEAIRTDALRSSPVDEDEDSVREREIEDRESRREPWVERFDPTGVDGAAWPMWAADSQQVRRAVERLRAEFVGLDTPRTMWKRGLDGPRRVRSDYRAAEVGVEGDWPATEVVVSFEHTDVPFLRLRRRYRVFDDTGRPRDWTYASIHLEEDIATGEIAPRSEAVGGVLEI